MSPSFPRKSIDRKIFSPLRSRNVESSITPADTNVSDVTEAGSDPIFKITIVEHASLRLA